MVKRLDRLFATMLVHHGVVQRLWQSLEDVANLKRDRDTQGLFHTGDTHKPIAVLLIWRSVLVSLVVLHRSGIGKRTSGNHQATGQQLLLYLQALIER